MPRCSRSTNRASTVPASTPDTAAVTAPATSAPPTEPPIVRPPAEYETIAPVLDTTEHVPALCLGRWIVGGMPPTYIGPILAGWSWDLVEREQSTAYATWGEAYVAGTWDPATQVFTISEARAPTAADRARFAANTPHADFSVPCPEPAGGWPARNQEWPEEQIHMIPGHAGSWEDTHQVVTVKFTGDLEAAETAVRQYYGDALCIVPAQAQQGRVGRDREPTDGNEQRPVHVERALRRRHGRVVGDRHHRTGPRTAGGTRRAVRTGCRPPHIRFATALIPRVRVPGPPSPRRRSCGA